MDELKKIAAGGILFLGLMGIAVTFVFVTNGLPFPCLAVPSFMVGMGLWAVFSM